MNILAIETSCDDTCIAILETKGRKNPSFKILSNIVSSQVKIHRKWGGVYPTLAKREHQRNLAPVLKQALSKARLLKSKIKNRVFIYGNEGEEEKEILFAHQKSKIDLIAVTVGPGLEPCLWTGVNFARELAEKLNLPIIPINHIVSSQVKIHRKWGGVYPTLAKREHQKNLPVVFKKALNKAQKPKINVIAVTIGPGLEPCLWTGVNFARELAEKLNLPIIPINHIEAHILANFIRENSKFEIRNSKLFPAVCLIVSGGHTQLILMKDFGKYKILGETRDDAAGECFDKVARILGLGYPGGPIVATQAAKLKTKNYKSRWQSHRGSTTKSGLITKMPRPMIYQKNYDFSFSGLKTAVLYKVRGMNYEETKKKKFIQEMCKETQQAIIDVLIYKTIKAAKNYKVKTILLGGGVAANDELRKQFNYKLKTINYKLKFLVPPKNLCTDNAAMIGTTAYFHWLTNKIGKLQDIEVRANLKLK